MEAETRKVLAILVCMFLLFLYHQTVWTPYVDAKLAERQAELDRQQGVAAQTMTLSSSPVTSNSGSLRTAVAPGGAADSSQVAPLHTDQPVGSLGKVQPSDEEVATAQKLVANTGILEASISLLGGRLTAVNLTRYAEQLKADSARYNLVDHVAPSPYPMGILTGGVSDATVQYQVVGGASSLSLRPGESATVVLRGELPDRRTIEKAVTFTGDSYLVDLAVKISAAAVDGSPLQLEWAELLNDDSPTMLDPYQRSGFVWFDDSKAARRGYHDFKADAFPAENVAKLPAVRWVSMSDKYFTASMINLAGLAPATIAREGHIFRALLGGGPTEGSFRLFLGPKSFDLLERAGSSLQLNIDFGMFGFISAPLLALLHLLERFLGNYGLAIVALTILVRYALFPLNQSAFKQMKAMQALSPEMKRIRETVKDKQQQQMELMGLYKKHGVNPLGGCLPMLLQIPIFLGLYAALLGAVELRHANFAYWIHDLSAPERLMVAGHGIPVLVVVLTILMVLQQYLIPSAIDPAQKRMTMIMSGAFGVLFLGLPAGLTIYMITNNLFSLGQQRALYSERGIPPILVTTVLSVALFVGAFILVKLSN